MSDKKKLTKEQEVEVKCVQVLSALYQIKKVQGKKETIVTGNELKEAGYPKNMPTKIFRKHGDFRIRLLYEDRYSILKFEEYMKSKKPVSETHADKPLPIDMSKKTKTLKQVVSEQAKGPKNAKKEPETDQKQDEQKG